MYDSGKIILGLAVFVLLITFPIWYNNLGKASTIKTHEPPDKAMLQGFKFQDGKGPEHPPAEEMRAKHMEMLKNIFHAPAVQRGYTVEKEGQRPTMSCMMCHGSKEEFCDSCHAHAAVTTPDCWTCHNK